MTFPDPTAKGNYFWPMIVKVGFQPRFNKQSRALFDNVLPYFTKGKPFIA